ncbi:MAG: pentapeptide repeat-containing protein, partial [Phormidesmis sp. CAN_BIN36]|nr:pentapeptide repeat-containing protein [Phormidesmis sp. CAN_BIN36]
MRKLLAQSKSLVLASVIAIAIVLTPLLLNLSKSTLFPLSLQPRDWTGFGSGTTETTAKELTPDGKTITKIVKTSKQEEAKTLWDWLSVLGVPLTLALLGFWFQWLEQEQSKNQAEIERERTEKQAQVDKEIAEINRQEEAIQAYFDRLSDLLVDKNLIAIASKVQSIKAKSEPEKDNEEVELPENFQEQEEQLDAAVDVIRARTLAILRRLKDDADRKNSVVEFLIEAEVIQKLKLSLEGADLNRANLFGANLFDANLFGA